MSSAITLSSHTLLLSIAIFCCVLSGFFAGVFLLARRCRTAHKAFDTLFHGANQPMLLLDRSGRVVRANGPALALFHMGSKGFENIGFHTLLDDPELAADDPWNLAQSPGKPLQCVFLRPKDRSRIHGVAEFKPLHHASHKLLLVTVADQSGIRRLHSCQARLYALYENCGDGVAVLQGDIFVYSNTAFAHLCGWDGVELGEKPARDVFHPHDRDFVWRQLTQSSRSCEANRCFVCRLRHTDGTDVVARITALCMQWGESPSLFCFFTDISANIRLESLRNTLQLLENADCNEPFERIIRLPRRVVLAGGLVPDQEVLLRSVEQAGYELLRTLQHPLENFSRSTGAHVFAPGPVDLLALLEKVAEDYYPGESAKTSGLTAQLDICGAAETDRVFVCAEAFAAYQLFYECWEFAACSAVPASTLRCTVAPGNGEVAVEFIFEVEEGFKAQAPSVSGLARSQGGALHLQGLDANKMLLSVRLSLYQEVRALEDAPFPDQPLIAPWFAARILFASADAAFCEACKAQLQHLPYVVELASDGARAAAQCRKRPYDLICMDMRMNDGLHSVQEIRRMESQEGRKRAPVVALLAANSDPSDRSYLEVGCQAVLPRPFELHQLPPLIERFIRTASSRPTFHR